MKTPLQHNLSVMDASTPSMRYDGKQDFNEWKKELRAKLVELTGLDKFKKCDPQFTVEHDKTTDSYREIRFTLQSEEGYTFPSVLRVPLNAKGKIPVVICLQGHSTGFHISLGEPKYPRDEISIAGGDRDFAVRILKEGYAALAVEQRNFGECGGAGEKGPDCYVSSMTAIMLGRTTIAERVWDVSCVIDAVEEHFDFLDSDKVYCMGNSGGGTTTFYAACLDERIKMAMPSCSVCTYRHSIMPQNHCACNFIPHSAEYFDMGDLSALIAPRKFVLVHGKEDVIFPDEGVKETFEITKKMFALAGAENNCALVTGNEGHRFYADISWPVFKELENN